MSPILLRFNSLTISVYGIFLGLSILFGVYLFLRQARKAGFSEEKSLDFVLVALTVSLLSARLVNYFQYPAGGLWFGGLSFSGGTLGFIITAYLYLRRIKWSILKVGDCLLPAVITAFGLSELGYFFGVGADIRELFFGLLYLVAGIIAYRFALTIRTGLIMYSGIFLLFFLNLIYRLSGGGIWEWGTLISLALSIYFMLGLKRRGYFMELYPKVFVDAMKTRLNRYLGRIEQQEKQLTSEDSSLEAGLASRSADAEDEAGDEVSHTFVQTTLGSLREMKDQIIRALSRMKGGKYGKCERCGLVIDKARLEAFPEATLCLSCEQRREDQAPEEA